VTKAQIKLPEKIKNIFTKPRGAVRFRCAYGGRGSGKSFSFAKMGAVYGYAEKLRILCTRELQTSIKESFHAELKAAIASVPWLSAHYDVGVDYIRGKNGTEFIFRGLRHNIGSIKSLAKIDLCIVEEAEDVPELSWVELEPTIRAPQSEIWVIWNPKRDGSPVDKRFIKETPPRCEIAKLNYNDNPWFPDVLDEQRKYVAKIMDIAQYAHIWEGEYWRESNAQVLKGKISIEDFKPQAHWSGAYFGADWGFSVDPTTLVKCYIDGRTLYIDREAYEVGVEIDNTPELFDTVPESRNHIIYADSARPETISYMRRAGFNIVGAKKGAGSVEDGVEHLRSYEKIIIHPRCKHAQEEGLLWSYKTDRLTGDVLPTLVDANNHIWDAVRYALSLVIRGAGHSTIKTGRRREKLNGY